MSELRDRLEGYFRAARPGGVVSAYLFGSHARGHPHRESDVDIGVILDRRAFPDPADRFDAAVRLSSELIAATHQNDVQVVVLNDVSPELGMAAVATGQRLFCADESGDREAVSRILLRHADLRPWLERMRRLKLEALSR